MIKGIDVVFIHARDAEKLGKWYKEILEIDISFQVPDFSWQEFSFSEDQPITRFAIDIIVSITDLLVNPSLLFDQFFKFFM